MERNVTKTKGDKNARQFGGAPDLGRVLRSPQSGTTNSRGAPNAAARKRRKNQTIMAWSIVFAVVSTLVMLLVIILYFKGLAPPSVETTGLDNGDPNLDQIFSETSETESDAPGQEISVEFVTTALSNRDPGTVEKFFKLPSDKTPEDAIRILEDIEASSGAVSKTKWLGTIFANGSLVNQVVVYMEKGGRSANRLAQLLRQADGEWRIDFDSYIRASSASWEKILSGKSPLATVRVFAGTDHYYNGIFSDDTIWQAFVIVSPDTDEILYAYAKRKTAQFFAMKQILKSNAPLHRVTLEIATLPDTSKRQFQISRVLAENWVVAKKPFDESF